MINVAIVGVRHQHPKSYLPLLQMIEGVRATVVAEADAASLKAFADETKLEPVADWRSLLKRDDVHAALIFLPHAEMPDCAVAFAEAGKHLIVEKPIAADVAGARRILEVEKRTKVKMSAPYVWRFHPVVTRIRELLKTDALGEVRALEGRLSAGRPDRYIRDNSPWMLKKSEHGGPMWNLGPHWIDLFRWLLGDDVVEVTGMLNRFSEGPDREIEDNSFALMRFASGAVATLDISYSVPPQYPAGRDLFVAMRGKHGDLSWSPAWGGSADELFVVSDRDAFRDRPVETENVVSRNVAGYGGESGLLFLEAFFNSIRDDTPAPISIADAVRDVEIAEAVYRSAASGKTVSV